MNTILAVDGVEIQRVPDQRQNELLAEFERRKKVGHKISYLLQELY